MNKKLLRVLFILLLAQTHLFAQEPYKAVKALTDMGYENVAFTDKEDGYVYTIQNSTYRVESDGIVNAIDIIQRMGMPEDKNCTIIVLDNNIPQISLNYKYRGDSIGEIKRNDWDVSYDTQKAWNAVKGEKRKNSSLFKVDIVIYPQLMFQNYRLSVMYEYVFNFSPAVEVSLWKGGKLTGQVIFPVHNDYGDRYKQIRPGIVTLSQSFRLPYNIFVTARAGFFSNFRYGADLNVKYILPDEHFWMDGRVGYTKKGYFDDWAFYHGKKSIVTGNLGINYFWTTYNTQLRFSGQRYLGGEYGMEGELIRHFRYASIGFYVRKLEKLAYATNNGYNGGFQFRIALPPFKLKRKGYLPRVSGGTFGFKYQAGNERIYNKTYVDDPDDNVLNANAFNPLYIKSELKR